MFQTRILVFYAGQYSISDSRQSGCSIEYFFAGDEDDDHLSPLQMQLKRPGDDSIGMRRAKANLPFSAMDKITAVPSLYMGSFNMRVGADGKPVQVLTDLTPIEGTYSCSFKRYTSMEQLQDASDAAAAAEAAVQSQAESASASSSTARKK